jgi:hypothetical protein
MKDGLITLRLYLEAYVADLVFWFSEYRKALVDPMYLRERLYNNELSLILVHILLGFLLPFLLPFAILFTAYGRYKDDQDKILRRLRGT